VEAGRRLTDGCTLVGYNCSINEIAMRRLLLAAATLSIALAALPARAVVSDIPAAGLPSATDYSQTVLPERAGVVSWRTLAQVEPVKQNGKMLPSFSSEILGLDQKDVKVQGFIIPLDLGDKQKRFLLSSVPPHCPFCMPAGPEGIVEVRAKTPVRYALEPIVVSGRFSVLRDDDGGLLYRITDATQVEAAPVAAK
jgi:hypothetical protein